MLVLVSRELPVHPLQIIHVFNRTNLYKFIHRKIPLNSEWSTFKFARSIKSNFFTENQVNMQFFPITFETRWTASVKTCYYILCCLSSQFHFIWATSSIYFSPTLHLLCFCRWLVVFFKVHKKYRSLSHISYKIYTNILCFSIYFSSQPVYFACTSVANKTLH